MTTPSNATACVLTDDHVDLIVSARAAMAVVAGTARTRPMPLARVRTISSASDSVCSRSNTGRS